MPIYVYQCKNGHRFEEFNSMANRLNATCPTCDKPGVIQVTRTNMRVAKPIRWLTADGKQVGWKPDGGISPPSGQPYPIGG